MDDKMDELTFNSICKILKSLDIIGRQVAILSTNAKLQQEYVRITARLEDIMNRYTKEEQSLVTETYIQKEQKEMERKLKLRENGNTKIKRDLPN